MSKASVGRGVHRLLIQYRTDMDLALFQPLERMESLGIFLRVYKFINHHLALYAQKW